MLEAFLLGCWLMWSSDREILPMSESLWFTLICVFLRALTTFELPIIDGSWAWFNGLLWLYAVIVFFIITRSNGFIMSLVIATLASIGYFQMMEHLPQLILDYI